MPRNPAAGEIGGRRVPFTRSARRFSATTGQLICFLVLAPGVELAHVEPALRSALRTELSPRHIPGRFLAIGEVPRTLNGKKCEVPVRKILNGARVEGAVSTAALANPNSMTPFIEIGDPRGPLAREVGEPSIFNHSWITVCWLRVIVGIAGMREYVDTIWKVMPDVRFEAVQFFTAPDDGRALFLFRQSGSAPARFGPGRFETYGCDIFLKFSNQKLSRYLTQHDITEMMRQYGALPPRGDLIGGSYLPSGWPKPTPTTLGL